MKIKLIAVDLDGTLLNDKQEISYETKEALQKASRSGIKIVPCSGRPFPGIKEYLDQLDLQDPNQYAVAFNGALVLNAQGNAVVEELLSHQDFQFFERIAQQLKANFHVEVRDKFITLNHFVNYYLSRESWLTRMPIEVCELKDIAKDLKFTKAMFSGAPSEMERVYRGLPQEVIEKYNVSTSDETLIEINSKQASKGNALKELARKLNLKQDEVMIFGDQKNDISMFDVPDFYKVAMGNAVLEIKKRANYVTRTNNEDGIAYAIRRLVFNE